MKCSKCGADIVENARFCPKCGEKVSEDRNSESFNNQKNNVFTKFIYSKNHVIANAIAAGIIFFYLTIVVIELLMMDAGVRIKLSARYYFKFDKDFKGILIIVIFFELILLITCVVRCVVISKLCLSVYNYKIAGVVGKNLFLGTENFEVSYSDVVSIERKKDLVKIETATKTYKCFIQDAEQAYRLMIDAKSHSAIS